jgi:hypothetical protein
MLAALWHRATGVEMQLGATRRAARSLTVAPDYMGAKYAGTLKKIP